MNDYIIDNFVSKLKNSTEEIRFALNKISENISEWSAKLNKTDNFNEDEKRIVSRLYLELVEEIEKISSDTDQLLVNLNSIQSECDQKSLDELVKQERNLYSRVRLCFPVYASIMTGLNWQSPAIKTSANTRIGIERELVKADWNDYKRDRSSDTFCVEDLYKKYIFAVEKLPNDFVLHILNSGMAAFTTIIYLLVCEKIIKNKILVSSQIYVENRLLLDKFFKDKLIVFDSNDAENIIDLIINNEPDVVFVEPVSNTKYLRLFDVKKILDEIKIKYKKDIWFVVDVTCSLGFDSWVENMVLPTNIKLVIHGSILKAPQLGLERVNAGFIQAINLGTLLEKVLDYRTLSGTSVQDFATYLLPATSKEMIKKRMKTIEVNAVELSTFLLKIDPKGEVIKEIVYPGLSNHPDFMFSKKINFSGFFFNIIFVDKYNNDKYFKKFTEEIIKRAKIKKVDVVYGGSFGFNKTSIYFSVGWDEPKNHYLRISPGTETLYEINKLKPILVDAFLAFKNNL